MSFDRWTVGAFVAALAVTAAVARTGGITVVVTDEDGSALIGATVTLSHELSYVKAAAILTDATGVAEFPVLRPGPGYSIEVSSPGYGAIRKAGLRVALDGNLRVPIQLSAQIEEQVRVVAEREVIQLETSEAMTKFGDAFIQDLPIPGRFYQSVLALAPGVQDTDEDGNPNVHGSRSRDFSAIVGGVRNVDPLTGQWMSRVNPNSIEELQVITAGAGVEFGRAQGGFARIIQKQGSNDLEGVFEFYFRSSKLDGDGAMHRSALPSPDFDWIQPAMQVTGPIVKDRLWFRLSHEYRKIDTPVALPGAFEVTTQREWTHSDQLTWQVSPRNKLALQLESDPQRITNAGVTAFRLGDAAETTKRSGETTKLTWAAAQSPRVLVESILAWQDLNRGVAPGIRGVPNRCTTGDGPAYLALSQCTDQDTGAITGSHYRTLNDHSQRLTVGSTATIFGGRLWGASHQFKLGFTVENERILRNLNQEPFGSFTRHPPEFEGSFNPPPAKFFARVSIPREDESRATGTNWGVFLEDQLKPLHNLAVTLGLRVDREELSSEGHATFGTGNTAEDQLARFESLLAAGIDPSDAHVPAFVGFEQQEYFEQQMKAILCEVDPRVGNCQVDLDNQLAALFRKASELNNLRRSEDISIANTNTSSSLSIAWSPGKSGKTAIKVGAGRHYNLIPLVIPLVEQEPALVTLTYLNFDLNTDDSSWRANQNLSVPDIRTVRRDLRTPYQDELTFAVERELGFETSLSLRYIRREFEDQIQDVNMNEAVGDYGRCMKQATLPHPTLDPHPWIHRSPIDPQNGFSGTVSSSFTVDPCPPGVCSPDEDDWLQDPFTGIRYPDTRVGPGDGWDATLETSLPWTPGYRGFDDCAGEVPDNSPFTNAFTFGELKAPDGITDLYLQNPFFGDIYSVGNLNTIDYEAVVLELIRRQYRGWEMNGSYTYSETTGTGEDFFQTLGDDPSLRQDAQGFQSYDQRHVVKLNAATVTPWGLRLGTVVTWQSGLPYSVLLERYIWDTVTPSIQEVGLGGNRGRVRQIYPSGSRNDGRNPSYWDVDVRATKEIRLSGLSLQLSVEVFNALNDATYSIYSTQANEGQRLNGMNEGQYRFGRQWQIGVKAAF